MAIALINEIAKIAAVDLFKRSKTGEIETGLFVARPFYLDYDRAHLLVADAWKQKAKGIPQGTFLLAYYENEAGIAEALLLRALRPTKLPTDSDIISSMIEYYKDNLRTAGKESQLDSFTRYEFSFSGLDCRILGPSTGMSTPRPISWPMSKTSTAPTTTASSSRTPKS